MAEEQYQSHTIVGMVYKDGVLLGATADNDFKFYRLKANMCVCFSSFNQCIDPSLLMQEFKRHLVRMYGPSAEAQISVELVARILSKYFSDNKSHNYLAALLGGVDAQGAHLYSISPNGFRERVPVAAFGPGENTARAMLQFSERNVSMSKEEADNLVKRTILAVVAHCKYTRRFNYVSKIIAHNESNFTTSGNEVYVFDKKRKHPRDPRTRDGSPPKKPRYRN